MEQNYRRVKYACYATNVSLALIGTLPPLLFLTFRSDYGISYSQLGLFVLVNYCTQLTIDLIFSFFSYKFNISKIVRITPMLTVAGLLIYALWPWLLPDSSFVGLLIGTVVFSASGGFTEVLISPVIAAIPADDPDREMSKLHGVFAWGAVFIVIFSSAFLQIAGSAHWQWLVLLFTLIPLTSCILFSRSQLPRMQTPDRVSGALAYMKNGSLWLCVAAIFLGGASECTMSQWCSGYLEQALGIPKVWGDVFGVALFSVMLGTGRTLYAKFGKNIARVLLLGAVGAFVCYLTAVATNLPLLGLAACAFTGFCVSMLWPGSLIVSTDRFPTGGVFIFAMMAAGGDFGASVGPQLVGVVTDLTLAAPAAAQLCARLGLTAEQLGMKLGLLVGAIFPLLAIPVFWRILHNRKHTWNTEEHTL